MAKVKCVVCSKLSVLANSQFNGLLAKDKDFEKSYKCRSCRGETTYKKNGQTTSTKREIEPLSDEEAKNRKAREYIMKGKDGFKTKSREEFIERMKKAGIKLTSEEMIKDEYGSVEKNDESESE